MTQAEKRHLAEHKAAIVKLLADTTAEPTAETPVVATMPERVVDPDLDQQAESVEFTMPEGLTIRFAEPGDEAEIVAPPPPCQQCGGFLAWWDILGRPIASGASRRALARVREQAERLRRRRK